MVGEIDRGNSAEFDAAVRAGLDPSAGLLVVDLSEVVYLDSAGLSVLFAHADDIEVVVPPLLAPILAISGLDTVIPVRTAAGSPGTE
ncbi:STAS domain-containing protein [Actinospica sp. MGRD01-02]|uniref:STAS domain-containing protein n=1 Tax=Actinospica acidithermotolerans TaxID=2828514 RepID=A0A941ECN5_9ACTN|nr:STAS domain-containing protein [Actinospica acidithermotolerans]